MSKLPWIPDRNLYWAVNFAIWLIDEHNFSLKAAIYNARDRYPIKKHIEKYVRKAYPKKFFIERSKKSFVRRLSKQELEQWINYKKESKRLEKEFKQIINE